MQNPNPPFNGWKPLPKPGGTPPQAPADLRAKYQLAPQDVSVGKIAGLVKGKENSSMEEISKIITSEHGVTQRLINIAYPRQAARVGATVQMATSRLGINRVIVVMVGDLLTQAVIETFETMVAITLEREETPSMPLAEHGYLIGSVKFTGQNNGQVTLALSPHLSLLIAANFLGGTLDDEYPPEAVNDAIGELVNIITGNLQSRLYDAGLPSEVGVPEVTFQPTIPENSVPGGSSDMFYFSFGTHTVVVNLSMVPSSTASAQPVKRAPTTKGTTYRANGA